MLSATQPISERAIVQALSDLGSAWAPQIGVDAEPWGESAATGWGPDFRVRVRWQGESWEFVVEAKGRSTPRMVEDAMRAARRWAAEGNGAPMIVVPYLGKERLEQLAQEGVSGLDLCGNGVVIVPGRLMLWRSGEPNRYPESRPARFAYRGATSLVPRVFLCRREYESVGAVQAEIERRGGLVALSTVSKALARMREDVLIERDSRRIVLVQPDKLLDALAGSFTPPRVLRRAGLRGELTELFRRACGDDRATSASQSTAPLVLSGASSQDRYAAGLRADEVVAYCRDLDALRKRLGPAWQETERFGELTVVETDDPTPFFDPRCEGDVVYASPVQTYVELVGGGEKRDREIAEQVREGILRDLRR